MFKMILVSSAFILGCAAPKVVAVPDKAPEAAVPKAPVSQPAASQPAPATLAVPALEGWDQSVDNDAPAGTTSITVTKRSIGAQIIVLAYRTDIKTLREEITALAAQFASMDVGVGPVMVMPDGNLAHFDTRLGSAGPDKPPRYLGTVALRRYPEAPDITVMFVGKWPGHSLAAVTEAAEGFSEVVRLTHVR